MLLVVRKYGQLCNRLFLFAHMIAAAREHGLSIVNPAFAEYAHLFPATASDLWCRWPERAALTCLPSKAARFLAYSLTKRLCFPMLSRLPALARCFGQDTLSIGESENCLMEQDWFAVRARANRCFWLEGYHYRARHLMERHADVIRHFFRPPPPKQQGVDDFIAKTRQMCDVLVGVHIRHGDYRTYQNGTLFLETAEYAALMRQVQALFPLQRVAFLVCSNEVQEAAHFDGLRVVQTSGGILDDLYALAACDFVMGPTSTFSAWAAFYGGPPLFHFTQAEHTPTREKFLPFFEIPATY